MKLEIAVLAGEDSKKFLVELSHQIDRLEKAGESLQRVMKGKDVEPEESEEDDEDFEPKKSKKAKDAFDDDDDDDDDSGSDEDSEEDEKPARKAKASKESFDDDEDGESDASDDGEDDDEEPAPKAKKGKAKKVTLDDCNDAAKKLSQVAPAGKAGRQKVYKLLKKHFGTETLTELKPDQYEKCVKVMTDALEDS